MKNILEKIKEAVIFWILLISLGISVILVDEVGSHIAPSHRQGVVEYEADCRRLGELRKELSRLRELGADKASIERVLKEMRAIERKHATPHRI